MTAWTVRDSSGTLLAEFTSKSRLDVERKVVPFRYDPFRLQVSPSYRDTFQRVLKQVLESRHWQIVRVTRDTGLTKRRPV